MAEILSVETVREISKLARDALRPEQMQLQPAAQLNEHLLVFQPGDPAGGVQFVPLPRPRVQPRDHRLYSVKSFLEFAQRAAGVAPVAGEAVIFTYKMAVWLNAKSATLILDDDDRRERAVLPLRVTECYSFVSGEMAKPKTQEQFLRMLRVELAGLLDSDELKLACTRLKFTRGESREGEVGQQVDTMGAQLRREVVGAANIPEMVKLEVPVLDLMDDDLQSREPMYCAVEIDLGKCLLALTPLPDQATAALKRALARVQAKLAHVPCPVYLGAVEPESNKDEG